MDRLIFSVVWTLVATAFCIGLYLQERDAGLGVVGTLFVIVFPFFGLWFIRDSVRRIRRRRSVRRVVEDGAEVYVWTELDGTEQRSPSDPREAWDAEDRDTESRGG